MPKNFLLLACLLAGIAVMLGAFGAHGLKARITADQLAVFETGVKYQFYHALALLAVGLLLPKYNHQLVAYAGYSFALGVLLFSGSLYLLSTRDVVGLSSWRWLGPITPIGGLCYIAGWAMLAWGIYSSK